MKSLFNYVFYRHPLLSIKKSVIFTIKLGNYNGIPVNLQNQHDEIFTGVLVRLTKIFLCVDSKSKSVKNWQHSKKFTTFIDYLYCQKMTDFNTINFLLIQIQRRISPKKPSKMEITSAFKNLLLLPVSFPPLPLSFLSLILDSRS